MAWRLGEYVVYGEIDNTYRYGTHGTLFLRGREKEEMIRLALTGDCGPDMKGKRIRFWPEGGDEAEGPTFLWKEHRGLQLEQIGPTWTMTAARWARVFECPVEEALRRAKLGEPAPTTWKRVLCLEWYSQNGRVVVEMPGAYIEECVRRPRDKDDEGEWVELANPEPRPRDGERPGGGLSITAMRDGEVTEIELPEAPERDDSYDEAAEEWAERGAEHGSTVWDSLQKALDAQAEAIDTAISENEARECAEGEGSGCEDGEDDGEGDEDGDDEDDNDEENSSIADLEVLDYCIEHDVEETPVLRIFPGLAGMPAPETLDDKALEAQLKGILAHLALLGIRVDGCEHATPRSIYGDLVGHLLEEMTVYEQIIGTGNVTYWETWEDCPLCALEADEEYERMKREEAEENGTEREGEAR